MYHYLECGLRNIWLSNGYREHKTHYGDGVAIDDIPGLHAAIAAGLVEKRGRLSASEVRYLRKEMELSQAALGAMLGVSSQTIALWEKGKSKITPTADRLLRLVVKGHYQKDVRVLQMIDMLNHADQTQQQSRIVLVQDQAWRAVA